MKGVLEARLVVEAATLPLFLPLLGLAPRGDGHPVLLVPPFIAGDAVMGVLKAYLKNRGHHVETWGFGRNTGFQRKFAEAIEARVRYMHHRHKRKVSLVGWSLGGMFSLYTAHRAPECVRNVITLGSPVSVDPGGHVASPSVHLLYRLIGHPMGPLAHGANWMRAKMMGVPPTMPLSCIFSDSDAIVPPHAAQMSSTAGHHENIRVPGSHIGLGFNFLALWIVADRLAQPEGKWRPFRPTGALRCAYRVANAVPIY
jgi:pimeloyl-ACP methyl ester carboxylesterase